MSFDYRDTCKVCGSEKMAGLDVEDILFGQKIIRFFVFSKNGAMAPMSKVY